MTTSPFAPCRRFPLLHLRGLRAACPAAESVPPVPSCARSFVDGGLLSGWWLRRWRRPAPLAGVPLVALPNEACCPSPFLSFPCHPAAVLRRAALVLIVYLLLFCPLVFGAVIDFEGRPGMNFLGGSPVPRGVRLTTQYLDVHGVVFSSPGGYVPVVHLGSGHATSGVNGIGAATTNHILSYRDPIVVTFFQPGTTNVKAVTDYVSVRADLRGDGSTIRMHAFDVQGRQVHSASGTDRNGVKLAINRPGIHSVRFSGTSTERHTGGSQAFDDLTFNPVVPVCDLVAPPRITSEPADLTARVGDTITLEVEVADDGPVAYQWSFAGLILQGETDRVLVIVDPGTAHSGDYYVTIQNCFGSTVSRVATLTVDQNLAPKVVLAEPTDGAVFAEREAIAFAAEASDSDGRVDAVGFFVDGVPIGPTFTSRPYEFLWLDAPPGVHVLTAWARDNDGAVSTSDPITITVIDPPANRPPSIAPVAAQTTREDHATAPIPFLVADHETSASELEVTVTSSDQALVPAGNLSLAGDGERRTLVIVPAPDQFGTTSIELVVVDGDGLSARTSFELRVLPVNDAPSFTKGPDLTASNHAGPLTIEGWATDIQAGPPNEKDQTLTFEVISDRPELFAAPPALSSSGTLSFTPLPTKHGSTTVTVTLRDSGGTEHGGVDTSAPSTLTIDIEDDARPPTVRWVQPLDYSAFTPLEGRTTVNVLLEADATGREPIERIDFYNGTTLVGTSAAVPYCVEWFNVEVGHYRLHAVATDRRGLSGRSEVVRLAVSALGGVVAIVRTAPHPEIPLLREYLFEMGLGSRVFDEDDATFETLDVFRLVLLHLGSDGRMSADLVTTLTRLIESWGSSGAAGGLPARTSGMPLFIVGEQVAGAASSLSSILQNEWLQVSRLHLSPDLRSGRSVTFAPETEAFKILRGIFGAAMDFLYDHDLERARATSDTTVWATAGEVDVFLTYPDMYSPDRGQARRAVQNFLAGTGGDNDSLASRKAVFQNTVCWLLHCSDCSNAALSLETSVQDVEVPAGDVFLLPLLVLNNGACEARASRLRVQLPAGLAWVGVEVPRGGSWTYDPVNQLGCVEIGIVGSGHPAGVAVDLTLRAVQPGAYEIPIELLSNNTLPNAQSRLVVVTGDAPPVLRLARLSDGRFRLHATGAGAKRYVVQQTPAVLPATAWTPLAEFTGPEWTSEAFSPVANQATFYRIVSAL